MSGQTLNLTRAARIMRRHMILIGACALLGLAANTVHTMVQPQVFTSSALVVLAPSVNLGTQAVVVDSVPVVVDAMRRADLGLSLEALQTRVHARRASAQMLAISVQGDTPSWARTAANAVSNAYVAYVTSTRNPVGRQPAQVFVAAAPATVKPLSTRLLEAAGLGFLIGLLVGVITALAIGRNDRRLRQRDAIADSMGVPVLASVRASSASDAAGWASLVEHYEPEAADAWQLRRVLRHLGVADVNSPETPARGTSSVTVLSLASDRNALAIGPQLAALAATDGVPTALVIGPQQDTKATAALRAACDAASTHRTPNLRLSVSDSGAVAEAPSGTLTVAVAVVDGQTPRVAQTMRAAVTVLGVTAGEVKAEQLVRVAASAAGDGRDIIGVLVANPLPSDETTGLMPELARPDNDRMPTRMIGVVTESI